MVVVCDKINIEEKPSKTVIRHLQRISKDTKAELKSLLIYIQKRLKASSETFKAMDPIPIKNLNTAELTLLKLMMLNRMKKPVNPFQQEESFHIAASFFTYMSKARARVYKSKTITPPPVHVFAKEDDGADSCVNALRKMVQSFPTSNFIASHPTATITLRKMACGCEDYHDFCERIKLLDNTPSISYQLYAKNLFHLINERLFQSTLQPEFWSLNLEAPSTFVVAAHEDFMGFKSLTAGSVNLKTKRCEGFNMLKAEIIHQMSHAFLLNCSLFASHEEQFTVVEKLVRDFCGLTGEIVSPPCVYRD